MKAFFRRLFNIYPGEEKKAFLFAFLGFLWALGVTSGLKFADALFLLHIGAESLPIVYICTALGMFVIALILLRILHTANPHRIFHFVLFTGIVFYLFAHTCLLIAAGTEVQWLWFALRIFGTIFFAVVVTCYWTFVDQYHHLQDAKRLYSLFSSMIFLGVATTGLIMRSGLIDFQHLTLVIVCLLLFTSYWIKKITREVNPVNDDNEFDATQAQISQTFSFLFRSILDSKFTLLLMAGNFLTFVLLVITEYSYLLSFDQHFDPTHTAIAGGEEDAKLTLFLGQSLAFVSISNLIFGLFLYSRLVRRFGSSSLLIITPTILLITYSGWPLSSSLIFPLMGYLVVEGTLYVIDDSNFNLLLNAVPYKVKYKIRVIIESFFEPVGMLISALLLSVPWLDSKLLGLFLSAFLLIIALLLRKRYFKAIYLNLSENAIHFQRSLKNWFESMSFKEQKSSEFKLLAISKHGNDEARIIALEALLRLADPTILNKIINEADKLNPKGKIQFVQLIADSPFSTETLVLDRLHAWIRETQDPDLKGAVHFFLARLGLLHPDKAIQDLKSTNLILKAAAIISLKKSWAQLSPHIAALNRTLAAQQLEGLLNSDQEEEVCMGLNVLGTDFDPHDADLLFPFLRSHSRKIVRTAAASISQIANKQCLRHASLLISQLAFSKDSEVRIACLQALGKIGDSTHVKDIIAASTHFRPNERRLTETIIIKMGLRTVPTLLSIVKDTSMHDRCRILAGRILGQLALPQLRANFQEIIKVEIERAYFYFFHYQTIQSQNPETDLRMLSECLLASFHSVQDFIIQLLGVAGEIEDIELLSRSIRSPNPKVRSQVVETLEKTCEPNIYRLVLPLVSDLPTEVILNMYIKEGGKSLSLNELLDKLVESSAPLDQIIAATLKHRLNLPNWRTSLIRQMSTNEEIFHHFACELLES